MYLINLLNQYQKAMRKSLIRISDQSSESEPEGNEEEFDSDSEEWNEDDCVENDCDR